jgi:hypothetical protein
MSCLDISSLNRHLSIRVSRVLKLANGRWRLPRQGLTYLMTLAMAGAYIVAPHLRWQTSLPLANNDEALQLPAGTPKSSIEAMTTVAAAKSPLQSASDADGLLFLALRC